MVFLKLFGIWTLFVLLAIVNATEREQFILLNRILKSLSFFSDVNLGGNHVCLYTFVGFSFSF